MTATVGRVVPLPSCSRMECSCDRCSNMYSCTRSIACARMFLCAITSRYPSDMAGERTDTVGATAQLGFDALFAIAHVQAHAVRLIDDALARAHGANLTGYELLRRLQ